MPKMKNNIDMTHKYSKAETHNNTDAFKRRMRLYKNKVLAEKQIKRQKQATKND